MFLLLDILLHLHWILNLLFLKCPLTDILILMTYISRLKLTSLKSSNIKIIFNSDFSQKKKKNWFIVYFHLILAKRPRSDHSILSIRRRQWHPTPELLPGKSRGRRNLVGCHLWGRTEYQTRLKWLSSSSILLSWVQLLTGSSVGLKFLKHKIKKLG